ncbi:hypothetical protein GJAV_G00240960 [Gymnothorax javanicus]|nr:hypothetical protein GJAV_G00240960 [Gymnothorax javanicus]
MEDIVSAGEKALVCLYNGSPEEGLDTRRTRRFHDKVSTSKTYVEAKSLLPTTAAAKYHSLSVYNQAEGDNLQPKIHLSCWLVAAMNDSMTNCTASIAQARKTVEQLKMETFVERIKVSKAAADLIAYCQAHIEEDPLIWPLPIAENPFCQKRLFCTIL